MMHGSHTPDERRSSWYQWTLVALALGTLLFGAWGQWRYEVEEHPEHAPDALSVIYHSFQLFILHGAHLDQPVPWQLQLGRFLGVMLAFTAVWLAFVKFFRHETLLMRLHLPWRRDHVVVCGLGDLGLRLALDARQRGKFVVAIDRQAPAGIERARSRGILVLEGDACDAALLRRARVAQSAFVVASCNEDHTNVAIAALVGRLLPPSPRRDRPLVCRLMVRDGELRRLLARESLLPVTGDDNASEKPGYRVNFQDLHIQDTAARQALRASPLDFQHIGPHDETLVHLIVIGFGQMGQSLALHAARSGHFANSVTKGRRLRLTVVDRDVERRIGMFRAQYPKIDEVCDLDFQEVDRSSTTFLDVLDALSQDAAETRRLITYAVCLEREQAADDRDNLRIGVELARRTTSRPVQTLIYQSTQRGFAALVGRESSLTNYPRLHAFGMEEDIYNWDILLHETEDQLARALHDDYCQRRRREGQPDAKNPDWEELDEGLKDSNRYAADHIPIKLRALGYHDAPLETDRQRILQFTDEERLLVAQMEHLRWCAERWLAGWEYGPTTDRSRRISRDLVKWDELPSQEQRKDPEQVDAVIRALLLAGRGIYR